MTDLGVGEVIHDAAGRAYYDVHAFAQHDRLGRHVDTPHQRRTPHVDPSPQRLKLLSYLCGKHRVSNAVAQQPIVYTETHYICKWAWRPQLPLAVELHSLREIAWLI